MKNVKKFFLHLWYGVILISRDRLVTLFSGRWGNCPKFCQTFDGTLIRRVVITKRLSI